MGYFILIIVIRAESSDLHVINSSLMIVRVHRNTQVSIYRYLYSVQIMPTEKKTFLDIITESMGSSSLILLLYFFSFFSFLRTLFLRSVWVKKM